MKRIYIVTSIIFFACILAGTTILVIQIETLTKEKRELYIKYNEHLREDIKREKELSEFLKLLQNQ